MNDEIELCIECDKHTDRAGIEDDSLYTDEGDGPFCFECFTTKMDSIDFALKELK